MDELEKIAFFELEGWEEETLKGAFSKGAEGVGEVSYSKDKLSRENAGNFSDASAISVFIYSKIDRAVLDLLPNLRLIATRSTGFDHIDVSECERRGISVANVPSYGENTVAEHTFALILALSRKIPKAHERTRIGDFSIDGLRGFDLKGKTLGVLGTGKIGAHVIRIANGFEMQVKAYDPFPNERLSKELGFSYSGFEEVVSSSDILTLHIPHNEATHHILSEKEFGKMKTGAVLINTSRGGLIETGALIRALSTGRLSGAGLDVLEEEGTVREEREILLKRIETPEALRIALENHLLLGMKNVIITPHNAFNSKEALGRILEKTIENLKGFPDKSALVTKKAELNV